MKVPSTYAVDAVARRGGLAPADVVRAELSRKLGADAARRGVGLAIVAGRLELVRLVDGSAGLQLVGRGES